MALTLAAQAIAIFFAKEMGEGVKKRVSQKTLGPVWDYVDSYLPASKVSQFEVDTRQALDQMSTEIKRTAADVAHSRIDPYINTLNSCCNWLTRDFYTFLEAEAKLSEHRKEKLENNRKMIKEKRIELDNAFDNGVRLLEERISSCDFPGRLLFESLQHTATLALIFFSWEYHLTKSLPPSAQSIPEHLHADLNEIQKLYVASRKKNTTKIHELIERLCKARLDHCEFTSNITKQPNASGYGKPNVLTGVSYEYKDSFYSDDPNDPFRGGVIKIGESVNNSFDNFNQRIYAYGRFKDCGRQHREHVARLEQLNNTYIREPAYLVLAEIDKFPYFLSKEQESREVNLKRLPADWNENPRKILNNPSYKENHEYLASMVIKELARAEDLGNKGNRWYPGWKLRELDYLESSNKSYRLWHQPSNFKLIFTRTNQTLWTSNTFANEIDVLFLEKRGQYLELQNDGNLVMYTESGKPVWSIGTDTQASNMLVHLNLDVPYEQSLARSGYLLSATGKFKLLLNDDGFLTLSDAKSGVRIWEPHTNGKAARELRMQADGNLVLYGGFEMDPVWASDTHNCGRGCRAVLEDWGDLVVYDKEGDKRLWSSDASVTELQINYARISGPFG